MTASCYILLFISFFFNDTATTEIYTLSLHDALPISARRWVTFRHTGLCVFTGPSPGSWLWKGSREKGQWGQGREEDRKSTRLNSSHANISYAVFCLKKKKHI